MYSSTAFAGLSCPQLKRRAKTLLGSTIEPTEETVCSGKTVVPPTGRAHRNSGRCGGTNAAVNMVWQATPRGNLCSHHTKHYISIKSSVVPWLMLSFVLIAFVTIHGSAGEVADIAGYFYDKAHYPFFCCSMLHAWHGTHPLRIDKYHLILLAKPSRFSAVVGSLARWGAPSTMSPSHRGLQRRGSRASWRSSGTADGRAEMAKSDRLVQPRWILQVLVPPS